MSSLEFKVNDTSGGLTASPDSARLSDGRIVIAWDDTTTDSDIQGVRYRVLAPDGAFLTEGVTVNTTEVGVQGQPSVAALQDGGFVITWVDGQFTPDRLQGQRCDAALQPVGGQFPIDPISRDHQTIEVIGLQDGGFALVFSAEDSAGQGARNVYLKVYDVFGRAINDVATRMNATTVDTQSSPTITQLDNGVLVAGWISNHTGDFIIQERRFDSAGAPLTLNEVTTILDGPAGSLVAPQFVTLPSGALVATWLNLGDSSIWVKQFQSGLPIQPAIQISPAGTSAHGGPSVEVLADGGFVVLWDNNLGFGNNQGAWAQRFDAAGQVTGTPELTNVNATGVEADVVSLEGGGYLALATSNNGGFTITGAVHDQASAHNDVLTLAASGALDTLAGNDIVTGSSGSDTIIGGTGIDQIRGGDGDDQIHLGNPAGDAATPGTEFADGGLGSDIIIGGLNDAHLYGGGASDIIRGGAGDDSIYGEAAGDVLRGGGGNDRIEGQSGDDEMRGNAGSDTMLGAWGSDTIRGDLGDDSIDGDGGGDKLIGGDGNDTLNGGSGFDVISGHRGDDILTGGEHGDVFEFAQKNFGEDVITDFENGLDVLRIGSAVASSFAEAEITVLNSSTLVSFGDDELIVILNSAGQIDAGDFVF